VAEKLREEKLEKRKATIKKILSSDKKNIWVLVQSNTERA
jgi:hypothetical protein